jgi:hypothetical protein
MTEREFRKLQADQQAYPVRLAKIGERTYWHFRPLLLGERGFE